VIAGEVVAMGALRRVSAAVAEVKRTRVDACHQRRGFGRAVLHGLEARARELGYRTLRLDTTVQQIPAQRLFRADGFVDVERTLDRTGETMIVLEKRLAYP
jgi:GNAT superfamily N-acetyltransferase